MRRRGKAIAATLIGVIALFGAMAWWGSREAPLNLRVLEGAGSGELLPRRYIDANNFAMARRLHYVRMPYEQALRLMDADLKGWGRWRNTGRQCGWSEPAGPFQFQGRDVVLRRNRIEPQADRVLGTAEDSKVWVTITIRESLPDSNVFRGFWRMVGGKARP